MKTKKGKHLVNKLTLLVVALMTSAQIIAQTPDGIPIPDENDPLEINTFADIFIFIVFPVLLVVFYVLWRRSKRRVKKEGKNRL